ncbi:MAG: hypothetical protein VX777_05435 [Chlamydiota bacterium]|nr:hypothetical protein [Chlamydiota bacterium]
MSTPYNISYNGNRLQPLKTVKCTHRPPWYLLLVKTIVNVVKKVFNFFCFWNWGKNKKWSPKQVEALNELSKKDTDLIKQNYLRQREIRVHQQESTTTDDTQDTDRTKINSIYANREFNPSLKVMREFVGDLSENAITSIYEKKLKPSLTISEESMDKAACYLKIFSSLLVNLGKEAQDQILDKLQESTDSQSSLVIERSFHKALHWLVSRNDEEDSETLLQNLEEHLEDYVANTPESVSNTEISEVMNWISYHKDPNYNLPQTEIVANSNMSTVTALTEKSVAFLIEKKIDVMNNYLKTHIINNLPNIVLNLLASNGRIFADEFSGRISELLEETSIQNFIGRLIQCSSQHVKHYINARQIEVDRIKQAKLSLKAKQSKERIDEKAPENFIMMKDAHPLTKEIYLGGEGHSDFEVWKEIKKKAFTKTVANDIYDTICTPVIVEQNGTEVEIDWIEYLWNRAEFPPEITAFLSEIDDFIEHAIPEEFNISSNIKEALLENTKDIIIAIIQSKVKKAFSSVIYNLLNEVTLPSNVAEILSKLIIPSTIRSALQRLYQNILVHNYSSLSKDLNNLRENKNAKENKDNLRTKLYELLKNNCNLFDIEKLGGGKDSIVKTLIDPSLEKIELHLQDPRLKSKKTKEIIQTIFRRKHSERDDRFGEVILDLVFKIGEFGGSLLEGAASFLTPEINQITGAMLDEVLREDYLLIDIILKNLHQKFGNKGDLDKALFATPPTNEDNEESADSHDKLTKQIHNISLLLHDMVIEGAKGESTGVIASGKIGVARQIVGRDQSKIEATLGRIFNRLFNHEALNIDVSAQFLDITRATARYADGIGKEKRLADRNIEPIPAE